MSTAPLLSGRSSLAFRGAVAKVIARLLELALPSCAVAIAILGLASCSSREIYDASQGWRRNECNKIGEQEKRERCLKEEAGRSYDDYRAGPASQPSR